MKPGFRESWKKYSKQREQHGQSAQERKKHDPFEKMEAAPCGWGRGVERWRQGPDHTSPPAAAAVTFLHSPQLVSLTINNMG